jgi:hypothetical protein
VRADRCWRVVSACRRVCSSHAASWSANSRPSASRCSGARHSARRFASSICSTSRKARDYLASACRAACANAGGRASASAKHSANRYDISTGRNVAACSVNGEHPSACDDTGDACNLPTDGDTLMAATRRRGRCAVSLALCVCFSVLHGCAVCTSCTLDGRSTVGINIRADCPANRCTNRRLRQQVSSESAAEEAEKEAVHESCH